MAATSYNLATGLSAHPPSMAQVGDVGLICNGLDANQCLDLRTGQLKTFGIAKPGSGTTATPGAAGNVDGDVAYRIRWKDASTGAISLPSNAVSASPSDQKVTINKGSVAAPDSRVTHWIVERTTDGGEHYHRVNVDESNPDGTAIGTGTYVDDVADSTLRNRTIYPENQAQPDRYPLCVANDRRFFMFGSTKHRPSCSVTNGSAAVSSSDGGFNSSLVGKDLAFDEDTDGKTYKIASVTDADSLTLAENYAGVTKSAKTVNIAGPGNEVVWSEAFAAEAFGENVLGKVGNKVTVGDAGEDLLCGVGLGSEGVLLASADRLYLFSYRINPKLQGLGGDGRMIPQPVFRGAAGRNCMRVIDAVTFGIDREGVWMRAPGGQPKEIGAGIGGDWSALNWAEGEAFWIGYDAAEKRVLFWVCESGESYPKKAYVWSLDGNRWTGTVELPLAATAGCDLPDLLGLSRCAFFTEPSGNADAYLWFLGIGNSFGADPTVTPLKLTVESGTATSITPTAGTFPTTGDKLKGVPVTLIRAADGSMETQVIEDNSASALSNISTFAGDAPTNGDTAIIGAIPCGWRTKRFNPEPTRKKKFKRVYVLLSEDDDAVDLMVRVYYDGKAAAWNERVALAEDGVSITAGEAAVTLDPGADQNRYYVPLGAKWADDVQLEFYSYESGAAWQIQAVAIEYELDGKRDPSKAA